MWTRDRLEEVVRTKMSDYHMVVVSNRQPYAHIRKSGKMICQRQPGGLVTALNPVMSAVGGTWVATGASPEDKAVLNQEHKVRVSGDDGYDLKRIFLSKADADAYYYGYCNEGLWPLSHVTYTRPYFSFSDWEAYQRVNRNFAEQIFEEVRARKAFVWVQDFHLALVAKYLKEMGASNVVTSLFWHIPWPNPEVFRICPQKKEILEGLLSYDLLGFQIRYHEDHFLGAVDRELEARIDRERTTVSYQGHETLVRSFPISVDFESIHAEAESPRCFEAIQRLKEEHGFGGKKIFVSVDRIDYTKGIPDKLRAFDRFLEKYPEYQGKAVFFQLGQISRIHIPSYKQINDEINDLVNKINWKYSTEEWAPVILTRSYMSYEDILALYRMADACMVGSLHDGMNLVAKEFVAARSDFQGALILSQFTGAARELTDAFLVNPYDPESFADTLFCALTSPDKELERRMRKMRDIVASNNIYRWAGKVMSQLLKFEFQEG